MKEPDLRSIEAILNFSTAFAEYIKACDKELYERARSYAIDCHEKAKGVEIIDNRPNNHGSK